MSSKSFKNYASIATDQNAENIVVSGRYSFQAEDEQRIVPDISAKLDLNVEDSLLEIGSGPGNLLIPLSSVVGSAAAIDNAPVLERLVSRTRAECKIAIYPGDFLSMELPKTTFSKVLIYSVLQYMDSADSALAFLDRALSLLRPGGKLLLGDLPNGDKKDRFLQTGLGRKMSSEWAKLVAGSGTHPLSTLVPDDHLLQIDDAFVMLLLAGVRKKGFETYLLPQAIGLPFCHTREDVLFVSPQ